MWIRDAGGYGVGGHVTHYEQVEKVRLLVVDDDPPIADLVATVARYEGWEAMTAYSGEDALRRAAEFHPDIVVLDLMLPGLDGFAVLDRLRQSGTMVPVVFLTARDGVADRVAGLTRGGDDYLVKPFAFAELLARIEALARRSDTVVKETVLRVGDLTLDLVSRTASRSGRKIELLPREFQVLEYLVRNEGRVVPRALLLQDVWDLCFDPTTNIIDVYVGRVRRKVDGHQAYPLIHTVRGVGFSVRAPR
jgi:two-component system OmpR family response regulator